MKVILKSTSMAFYGGGRKEGATRAREITAKIDKQAIRGVPYGMVTMVDQVQALYEEPVPMGQISRTLQELVQGHGWRTLASWGFMMKGSGDVQLGNLLSHGLPRGIPYSMSDIAKFVEVMTGESMKSDTIRKSIGRLVEQERFRRVDTGVFEKMHRGF